MCISAAHSILDCFLQLTTDNLQKAPGVVFVRAIYALVALMKADYATGTDAEGMGEVIDSKSLKVDFYLDTVLRMTTEAIGPQKCRIPSHWQFVLEKKLKAWHDEHQQWRRDGGHLKRNKQTQRKKEVSAAAEPSDMHPFASFASQEPVPDPAQPSTSIPPSEPAEQGQAQNPLNDFNMSNPYQTWPSSSPWRYPVSGNTNQATGEQPFGPDMTDFSAAFQNGDLYLWNDISDNFGGWVPQGGTLYSDMQFGGMNMGF